MKNILYFASAMALTLASCGNDDSEALAPETNDSSDSDVITLSASVETDSPSRVSFTSDGKFFWTNDDMIAVYNTDNSFSELTINSEDAGKATAKFTGSISGSTSTCAVYPASAAKSLSGNTLTVTLPDSYTYTTLPSDFPTDGVAAFNSAYMPMVAKIATDGDTNLSFKNLGGLFCFKFNDVPEGTCKIVFTANMQINGDFSVDLTDELPTITATGTTTQTNKEVTVNFTALESASDVAVYLPVPCSSYVGFKVKMYDASDNVTKTILSAKTHEIQRCTARRFNDSEFGPYNGKNSYAVDLGLPSGLKWASCNIGASSASDVGSYYQWGNTTVNADCNASNCPADGKDLTTLQSEGRIDGSNLLTPGYDAATANWGGNWRMPTPNECQELYNNCTWEWTTQDGINGYKVTSKKNGYTDNSIFLPVGGYLDGTTTLGSNNGYYLSSQPNSTDNIYTLYLLITPSNVYPKTDKATRCFGCNVRPVIE